MTFDPRRICRELNAHKVRYVLVGGFAAAVHGSPLPTDDVDIVPDRGDQNLQRLGQALTALDARIRTSGEPVVTRIDGAFLAAMPFMLNLTTPYGDIDLTFDPTGPLDGYAGWRQNSTEIRIGADVTVQVAALGDVIASKRAAGREKDIRALPYLQTLHDELTNE